MTILNQDLSRWDAEGRAGPVPMTEEGIAADKMQAARETCFAVVLVVVFVIGLSIWWAA